MAGLDSQIIKSPEFTHPEDLKHHLVELKNALLSTLRMTLAIVEQHDAHQVRLGQGITECIRRLEPPPALSERGDNAARIDQLAEAKSNMLTVAKSAEVGSTDLSKILGQKS